MFAGKCGAMAAKDVRPKGRRGRRVMRDISIETHTRSGEAPSPVLPRAPDAASAAGGALWPDDATNSVTLIPKAGTEDAGANANAPPTYTTTNRKEGGIRPPEHR